MPVMTDGFATIIEFSLAPSVQFKEKTVKPPGFDGGGTNDTTTMRNTAWRTRQPKKLKSLTAMTFKAAYSPAVLTDINTMMNQNQLITVTFPDGDQWQFWGWLDKFDPDEHQEGEQPTASCTIEPSNQDNDGNEVAPVYNAA